MWELYNTLIDRIPSNLTVEKVITGAHKTLVKSQLGLGISNTILLDAKPFSCHNSLIGQPVKNVAGLVKSWNLLEASIGIAALNSYFNTPEVAEANGFFSDSSPASDQRKADPFILYQNLVKHKKVATIGHTKYLHTLLKGSCELTLIGEEKLGFYPSTAAEFLLPNQDFLFLSATAFLYKSIERLLHLAKKATIILYGSALPMSPSLFHFGVYDLSGFVILEPLLAEAIVSGSEQTSIYRAGKKVRMTNKEFKE